MSILRQDEQTTPAAEAATLQVIYPKLGSYARMDSTGVEKIFMDAPAAGGGTSIGAAASFSAVMNQYLNFGGL